MFPFNYLCPTVAPPFLYIIIERASMVIIPGRKHLAVRFVPVKILLNISLMHLGVTNPCPPWYEKSGLAPAGFAFLALTQASNACIGHRKFVFQGSPQFGSAWSWMSFFSPAHQSLQLTFLDLSPAGTWLGQTPCWHGSIFQRV